MRTLVIAGDYPWPEDRGPRMRLAMVLRGLRRCGPVELCSVISQFRTDFGPPDQALGLADVARVGFDNRPATGVGRWKTLARPSMPLALPWQDGPAVQRALARFMSGRYDLVWIFGARPWVLSGEQVFAPTILDLDDLEDQKITARLSVPGPLALSWSERLRRSGSSIVAHEEIRRWRRLHRLAARRASAIVVCSSLDARRVGLGGTVRVAVVPNGYRLAGRPVGRPHVGTPPTVLFQGLLSYPPNIDAARVLVDEVGPRLRALVPGAQIRLVGEHGPDLMALHDPPHVIVVGRVPDITSELARADLVAVPLRYGSGTRVKIIEAFAHRIPVVSTSLGAEGLGTADGVHLLIGDDPGGMAEASARLLLDPELRKKITSEAHDLFVESFCTDAIEERIAGLAREVSSQADP
jgi:glycosyltransferase involved in cell wall biosynthesis